MVRGGNRLVQIGVMVEGLFDGKVGRVLAMDGEAFGADGKVGAGFTGKSGGRSGVMESGVLVFDFDKSSVICVGGESEGGGGGCGI